MPIASIAIISYGREEFGAGCGSGGARDPARSRVAAPSFSPVASVGCFLSPARRLSIKTSKNVSEPAKLFLAITRRNGYYTYPVPYPRKLTAVLSDVYHEHVNSGKAGVT